MPCLGLTSLHITKKGQNIMKELGVNALSRAHVSARHTMGNGYRFNVGVNALSRAHVSAL